MIGAWSIDEAGSRLDSLAFVDRHRLRWISANVDLGDCDFGSGNRSGCST